MAEEWTLTTSQTKTITAYQVRDTYFHYDPPNRSAYDVLIVEKNGGPVQIRYVINDTPANANLATSRIKALNTLNLSTQSMQRRLLNFAATDINPATGEPFLPPGNVTGTPDV